MQRILKHFQQRWNEFYFREVEVYLTFVANQSYQNN